MLTRNQRFAVKVFEKVEKVPANEKQKYGTMAQKLPVLIRTAGLAQAISFLQVKAKSDSGNKLLLEHLAQVVEDNTVEVFAENCRKAKLNEYLQLTQNTLAALLWFKRFSVSVLGVKENADTE